MIYHVIPTKKFAKDLKRAQKRGWNLELLNEVVKKLASGQKLERNNKDHDLSGDYAGFRECHITPDWLLVYVIDGDKLILTLSRTGTHSDLF